MLIYNNAKASRGSAYQAAIARIEMCKLQYLQLAREKLRKRD